MAAALPRSKTKSCIATTLSTSRSIRLNSSKQPQQPHIAMPLNTLHCAASPLARSLTVSVLPEPAGP
eukprot:1199003-Prymnesium_polylepis.1